MNIRGQEYILSLTRFYDVKPCAIILLLPYFREDSGYKLITILLKILGLVSIASRKGKVRVFVLYFLHAKFPPTQNYLLKRVILLPRRSKLFFFAWLYMFLLSFFFFFFFQGFGSTYFLIAGTPSLTNLFLSLTKLELAEQDNQ